MHVLTKIFIVLVSLLSVLLVPLVVVYAHNEASYKADLENAMARADSAQASKQQIEDSLTAQINTMRGQMANIERERGDLRSDKSRLETDNQRLQADLAQAEAREQSIDGHLAVIESRLSAGQALNESLIEELRDVRDVAVEAQKRQVDLDDSLRDVQAKLDVAEQARRMMAEELARVKEERDASISRLGEYQIVFGPLPSDGTAIALGSRGKIPPFKVDGTVLNVRRDVEETLADINLGSRDGIEEGFELTITDGIDFVGVLRIIRVDETRSTGRVDLEGRGSGKQVAMGMRAFARPE